MENTLRTSRLEELGKHTKDFLRRYRKNKPAVLGLALFLFLLLISIVAPIISPYNPWEIFLQDKLLPPSSEHFFGTDNFGRDILSRVIFGSRTCLLVIFSSALVTTIFGILIGGASGYFGGYIDDILMRITELFLTIPRFFLVLLIVTMFGGSLRNLIIIIGLTSWPGAARLVRAQFLSLKEREFVEAARLVGASSRRIIFKHILPNAIAPLIVQISLQVGQFILLEASLSFLGLGDISKVTWGQMLYRSQLYARQAWWMSTFPGLAIFLSVLSFNLIGEGINDTLDPRLKER